MRFARPDYQKMILDASGKIPDDEPVFLLRAKDRYAMTALRAYIAALGEDAAEVAPDMLMVVNEACNDFQNWQLKELREKGLIAFYETRAREVILYFRHLRPGETKTINLDLVAVLPGKYIGPASRAFLYYTNEYKTWVQPETIVVKP